MQSDPKEARKRIAELTNQAADKMREVQQTTDPEVIQRLFEEANNLMQQAKVIAEAFGTTRRN